MLPISTTFSEPTTVYPLRSVPASATQNVRLGSSVRHHAAKDRSKWSSSTCPPVRSAVHSRRSRASAGKSRSSATRTLTGGTGSATGGRDGGDREQGGAARADLDVGTGRRAHPAVEAGRPAAVVLLLGGQRVLPVVPQPVWVQPGVQVRPGQHLVPETLPGGEPGQADPSRLELCLSGGHPAVVGEVLAP